MASLLGRVFLWFTFLAAASLLGMGVLGISGQSQEADADFAAHLALLLAMPMCFWFAWLRTRTLHGGEQVWLTEPTVRFRRRFATLVGLALLWLVTGGVVVTHYHLMLGQPADALSAGALLGHLLVGWWIWVLLRRTARRTKFLDDPTLTLDAEGRAGERVTAFVAQPVRHPVGLTRWEIALVCERIRRRLLTRATELVHEDRREVAAGRVAHRGEILHGGGAFELPPEGPPSTPGIGLPRVEWHLESTVTLEGVGTFGSRFRIPVEPAER